MSANHAATKLCHLFGTHRSSYRYWLARKPRKDIKRARTKALVKQVFTQSNQSAGARTIATAVSQLGDKLSRYRAGRMMKEMHLVSSQLPKHQYKKTGGEHLAVANVLNRQFNPDKPNKVWVGDMTYIWTGQRWMYLAVVLDLYVSTSLKLRQI